MELMDQQVCHALPVHYEMREPGTQHHDRLYLARWAASNLLGNWDRSEEGDEGEPVMAQPAGGDTSVPAGGRTAAGGGQPMGMPTGVPGG